MTLFARPAAPPRPFKRDWYAPALLAASLLAHVAALALMLRAPHAAAAKPPAEIPVEIVQQMPAEKPVPPKATPPAEKPAAKPPAQPRQAEPEAAKSAPRPTPKSAAKAAASRPTKSAAATPKEPAARRAETPDPPAQKVAERMAQLLGPMPAAVMPTTTSSDNPLDDSLSYRQMVLSKVARQRREDRHNGIPGHVVVAFVIGDAGEVVSCAVREKSTDPALDAEAVAMVHRGEPYPPPPPGSSRDFSFGLAFRPS